MALLESVFSACRQTCVSESFRKKLNGGRSGGRALFFGALPMKEWNELLNPLECQAEFRIARALASITGLERHQSSMRLSSTNPSSCLTMLLRKGVALLLPPHIGQATNLSQQRSIAGIQWRYSSGNRRQRKEWPEN